MCGHVCRNLQISQVAWGQKCVPAGARGGSKIICHGGWSLRGPVYQPEWLSPWGPVYQPEWLSPWGPVYQPEWLSPWGPVYQPEWLSPVGASVSARVAEPVGARFECISQSGCGGQIRVLVTSHRCMGERCVGKPWQATSP